MKMRIIIIGLNLLFLFLVGFLKFGAVHYNTHISLIAVLAVALFNGALFLSYHIYLRGPLQVFNQLLEEKNRSREKENQYLELVNNMSSGVVLYEAIRDGEDFIIKSFNAAAERIEQISEKDIKGRLVTEVFPGVIRFGLLDVFRRVWVTGQSESYPVSFYEDNRISGWRENFVYRLSDGHVVAVYDDITSEKQSEEQLKLLNEKLEKSNEGLE